MSGVSLTLYHQLPPPVRSIAATLRGLYLRRWRYGPETERLVEQALVRERWDPERWQAWRQQRLAFVLERAATKVPYYREYWTRRRGAPADRQQLDNWPILDKEAVRRNPAAFVADDCDRRRMWGEHTSGTTGKPLRLWFSRDTVRQWYALFEARWRRAYGVSRHDRWANIGGQLVTPVRQQRPPFWVWNAALKQLYMSSYHLSAKLLPYYLEALVKYRITYLYGYTSSLCALAQEADRQGWRESPFKVALTNAEPLLKHQRRIIQNGLNCPVRETFGMSEIVANASECEHGRLHLWPEVGIVEVLDGDRPAPRGTAGEMVCTGLLNSDMPLIRYRLGDRGCLPADESACSCGRSLPCLAFVEGRTDDVLMTSDGRRVGRLDPVFKADLPIYEAQIIQESLGQIRVRYVPAPGYTAQDSRSIIERLQQRLGSMHVVMEPVAEIPRGPNGKFRAVVSKLAAGAPCSQIAAGSTPVDTISC